MTMRWFYAALALFLATGILLAFLISQVPAQVPLPANISQLETERDQAFANYAIAAARAAEAKVAALTEENAKLKAEIEELKKK